MKFLLYGQVNQGNIQSRLGAADYSYFFLMRAFAEVLANLGEVVQLGDPAQADEIHQRCEIAGERCVLLSFSPPHKTLLDLVCPVIPVFAWEFPDIPGQIEEASWMDDPRNDWRHVFYRTGRAIALSSHTVEAVKRVMGVHYPIMAIPSPLRVDDAPARQPPSLGQVATLRLHGSVVDSYRLGLDADALISLQEEDGTPFDTDGQALPKGPASFVNRAMRPRESMRSDDVPPLARDEQDPFYGDWSLPAKANIRLDLRGVVYTAVLVPEVGRKNWQDLLTGFCWTFRDTPDATLVLKLAGAELPHYHCELLMLLTKLSPFQCRIITINGYLTDEDYASLVAATTYYVNTSLCEGLCLPLVEFLGAGVPAIAPANTAMADYVSDEIAFVVDSYPGVPTVWPHGDREVNRTTRDELDWESLLRAYWQSYVVAQREPQRYARMSARSREVIRDYCGPAVVEQRLCRFFGLDQRGGQEISQATSSTLESVA